MNVWQLQVRVNDLARRHNNRPHIVPKGSFSIRLNNFALAKTALLQLPRLSRKL